MPGPAKPAVRLLLWKITGTPDGSSGGIAGMARGTLSRSKPRISLTRLANSSGLFRQTLSQSQQSALLFLAAPQFGTPPTNNTASASWSRALFKLNTSYQIDQTDLVYATWSQGFRRGNINALPAVAGGVITPTALDKVQPDTADNYEIGAKGTIDNRFRCDTPSPRAVSSHWRRAPRWNCPF